MRKCLFLLTFFLLLGVGQVTRAQTRGFIEGGLALPKMSFSATDGLSSESRLLGLKKTFYLGAGVNLKMNRNIYTDASVQWTYFTGTSVSYFRLPVAFMYQISNALPLQLGAGGYFAWIPDGDSLFDYGVLFKARYSLVKNFFVQASYHLGLKNYAGGAVFIGPLDGDISLSAKYHSLQLGVGLAF